MTVPRSAHCRRSAAVRHVDDRRCRHGHRQQQRPAGTCRQQSSRASRLQSRSLGLEHLCRHTAHAQCAHTAGDLARCTPAAPQDGCSQASSFAGASSPHAKTHGVNFLHCHIKHNSAPPLTHSRHAWAAALQATCRTRCSRQGGSAAASPSWTIACSAALTYVCCMLTWAWQAVTAASAAARRALAHARAAQLPAASHTHTAMRHRQCCQRHRYSSAVLTELAKQHRASRPHAAACKPLCRLSMLLATLLAFSLPQLSQAQSYTNTLVPPDLNHKPEWHLEDSVTYASKTGISTPVLVPHLQWEIRHAATPPRRQVLLMWQLWMLLR
jgi:hypothetical protein